LTTILSHVMAKNNKYSIDNHLKSCDGQT